MKLLIHDLTEDQCTKTGIGNLSDKEYIIVDSKRIDKYCIGCFGCWLKTPGTCIIKDEFQHMGENIAKADELVIISKSSFGSYSSSVKNVLDRSISYVMPFYERNFRHLFYFLRAASLREQGLIRPSQVENYSYLQRA